MLTQCRGLTESAPIKIELPSELSEACNQPEQLPEGTLTQAQIEVLWERDRGALKICGDRVFALQNIIIQISR